MSAAFATPVPLCGRAASTRLSPRSAPTPPPALPRRAPPARMAQRQPPATLSPPSPAALAAFRAFFAAMPGPWNSQRTYHYMYPGQQEREESQTTYDVERITPTQIAAVLDANAAAPKDAALAEGFRVSYLTRMASQEALVRSATNLAFVPETARAGALEGAYYRDVGYEEAGPITARFVFDVARSELQMTTYYTKIISVDEIRLVNNRTRLRRIINYRHPKKDGDPLTEPALIGFGVERKGEEQRLVE